MSSNFFATYSSGSGGGGGGGTVTSVSSTGANGLTLTTTNPTTTPNIALGGVLTVPGGGTGVSTIATGQAVIGAGASAVTTQVVTPLATAGSIVSRDSNGLVAISNLSDGVTVNVGLGSSIFAMTVASTRIQVMGGLAGTFVLPDATTLPSAGIVYEFQNHTTGSTLTIQDHGNNQLAIVPFGGDCFCTNTATGTVNGTWTLTYLAPNNGTAGQILTTTAAGTGPSYQAPATAGIVTSVSVASSNGFAGTSSGGSTPALTLSTTINSPVLAGNGTAIIAATTGALTDTGTDGIIIGNGSGAVIGSGTTISQHVADTTHNGYLASADWNTFNSKGSGTVTSMSSSGATGLTLTTTNPTTTPAIALGGTLTVPGGGTGAATLAANGVLYGNGASAIGATAAGTTNQVLTAVTSGAPVWTATTGTGNNVFATSPTLVTPVLGTPSSGNLSNCTAYPAATSSAAGTVSFEQTTKGGTATVTAAAGGGSLSAGNTATYDAARVGGICSLNGAVAVGTVTGTVTTVQFTLPFTANSAAVTLTSSSGVTFVCIVTGNVIQFVKQSGAAFTSGNSFDFCTNFVSA
jgi:hypothetical protein